jgi:hypothetical protein
MSVSPTNPFVLPGLGQSGEHAANPLLASMEMMRQAFAGLAGTGGFSSGMPMAPSMNPEDLEKRISELKTVENWLKLNLSMLSSTIQGMEVQLATIATLRSFAASMSQTQQTAGADTPTALEVMLGLRPQTRTSQSETKQETPPEKPQQPAQEPQENTTVKAAAPQATGATQDESSNVPAAAKAWWDMLQNQFGQVAAATAATLKQSVEKSAPKNAAKQSTTTPRSVKKTATGPARKKPTTKK